MSKKNDNLKIRDNKDGTYSCRLSIGYKKDPLTGKTKQNRPTITVKADSEAEAKALITLEKYKLYKKEKDIDEQLTMAEVISRYKDQIIFKRFFAESDRIILESLREDVECPAGLDYREA